MFNLFYLNAITICCNLLSQWKFSVGEYCRLHEYILYVYIVIMYANIVIIMCYTNNISDCYQHFILWLFILWWCIYLESFPLFQILSVLCKKWWYYVICQCWLLKIRDWSELEANFGAKTLVPDWPILVTRP